MTPPGPPKGDIIPMPDRPASPRHLLARVLVFALGCTWIAPTPGVRAEPASGRVTSPEDSVKALESVRAQALLHADTTALSRLTADEFIEVSRFGTLRTKADNLREIGSGILKLTSVHYDSLSVRIYGTTAVLRGIADNTGTLRGFPFSGRLWFTRVFVRRDGRWQAVAMQHTMIP
jgi:hypothetical protein